MLLSKICYVCVACCQQHHEFISFLPVSSSETADGQQGWTYLLMGTAKSVDCSRAMHDEQNVALVTGADTAAAGASKAVGQARRLLKWGRASLMGDPAANLAACHQASSALAGRGLTLSVLHPSSLQCPVAERMNAGVLCAS